MKPLLQFFALAVWISSWFPTTNGTWAILASCFAVLGLVVAPFCAKGQPRAQVAITGILCVGRFVSDCWIDHGIFRLGWWNSCGWCHYARFCHWMGGLSAHDRVGAGPRKCYEKRCWIGVCRASRPHRLVLGVCVEHVFSSWCSQQCGEGMHSCFRGASI